MDTVAYRAKWIATAVTEPFEDGILLVRHGIVERCEPFARSIALEAERLIDLGDSLIMPKPMNAHTHLDLSDFSVPFGRGLSLPEWIPQVVAARKKTISITSPLLCGILEADAAQTLAIADCTQSDADATTLQQSTLGGWTLRELIAPQRSRFKTALQQATDFLSNEPIESVHASTSSCTSYTSPSYTSTPSISSPQSTPRSPMQRGLAPHATYTVPRPLLEKLIAVATRKPTLLAMHVAESPLEEEFLRSQTGPFRQLLESLGVTDFSAFPQNTRFLDLLQILSRAWRTLVIHGNFLTDAEVSFLSEHRDRMAVVHCPQSFSHFGYTVPVVSRLRRSGVRVVLGTDGRSSAASLDLWEEMQTLLQHEPSLSFTEVLRMATYEAAVAMGQESYCGAIVPGRAVETLMVRNLEDNRSVSLGDGRSWGPNTVCFQTVDMPL